MNKRKMTSIALVAAVAISTVQLAYPADVFAHENLNVIENDEMVPTTSNNNLSGNCGATENDKVTWELRQNNSDNTSTTYTLQISGTGKMMDYDKAENRPWHLYADKITKLVVDNGITELGKWSFGKLTKLNDVELPESLDTIGGECFNSCTSLKKIKLPENLSKIRWSAFCAASSLEEISLPKKIDQIELWTFGGCSSLKKVEGIDRLKSIGEAAFAHTDLSNQVLNLRDDVEIGASAFYNSKINGRLVLKENSKWKSGSFSNTQLEVVQVLNPINRIDANNANAFQYDHKLIALDYTSSTNLESVMKGSHKQIGSTENKSIIYLANEKAKQAFCKETGIVSSSTTSLAVTNGGRFSTDYPFKAGVLAKPEQKDHVFVGWYDNPEFTGDVYTNAGYGNTNSVKPKVYYARWVDSVAEVGGVEYVSLEEAIKNADGKEVVVKKNIELNDTLKIENNLTINFNGKIVSKKSGDGPIINVRNSANVVIKDANFKSTSDKAKAISVGNATVTISGEVNTTVEGSGETFPVVELTNKESHIKVNANSIINGHEIPSIGEVGTSSGSNDIVFDNNVNNDITLDDVLNDILGDKTNEQIVAKIVEETTTNSIKINTWDLGLKDEVYGIVETKNATNNNRITPINGWKKPEGKFVTFDDGLSSGKEYTIYIKGNDKDNAEVKIEKIVPSVKTKESSGGGSIPSVPSKPSKPVYTHKEVIGANRYETAAKVADELGSYDNVVLVNATSTMSDGLAASGLAGKENGAILLTKKDSIPKATMDRIKKVKKVYIIGGENAISQKVSNQITAANIKVERIGGKNRVETSELVAEKLGNYSNAFIVNGFKGEADAMSASAIAARYEAPILLTNGKTSTHAKKSGVEYYVVGGTSVVNKSIADKYNAERLAGKDRYATNREVIDEFYSGSDKLYLANGETLVDALTASTIAKNHGIVLVNKKSDNSVLKDKNTVQIGGMNFDIDFDK